MVLFSGLYVSQWIVCLSLVQESYRFTFHGWQSNPVTTGAFIKALNLPWGYCQTLLSDPKVFACVFLTLMANIMGYAKAT